MRLIRSTHMAINFVVLLFRVNTRTIFINLFSALWQQWTNNAPCQTTQMNTHRAIEEEKNTSSLAEVTETICNSIESFRLNGLNGAADLAINWKRGREKKGTMCMTCTTPAHDNREKIVRRKKHAHTIGAHVIHLVELSINVCFHYNLND